MKTPHLFFEETNERIIDVDGSYGGQCWDLFSLFTKEYCGEIFSCLWTGYVIDLWEHFEDLHLDYYFDKVYNWQDFQDGDWVIWKDVNGQCMITKTSHIAMFRKDELNTGGGIFLTQNPDGNPNYTHQMWISYNYYVGALRPKCYIKEEIVKPAVELPKEETPNDEDEELAIELINSDKKNPLIEFIKWIIKLIQKWKGNNIDGE